MLIIIFRGVFTNFIKQNYTDFEEERLREKSFCMFQINITSSAHHREKKYFLREILIIFF